MNELSTKLTKINFKWLMEHCTDKENWKKTWTLYDYDGFKCVMSLHAINIKGNSLSIRFDGNGFWNFNTIEIPMDEEHFNEIVFTKKVYSCMKSRIDEYERGKICETETYKDAKEKDYNAINQLIEQANNRLDELGIEDEEVREAYIDKKTSDLDNYKYRDIVSKKFKKTVLTQNYAMLSLMFNENDEYEELMLSPNVNEDELKDDFENIEYEYQEEIDNLLGNN